VSASTSVNLRYAAALTLVGWYLMTPALQSMKCWNVPNPGLASILGCQARIESQAPVCGELLIFHRKSAIQHTQARRRIIFRLTAPDLDKAKEEKDFGVVD
jgi:hypothetical protein